MKKTYLFTRKIDKQDYKFYHLDFSEEESWTDKAYGCFQVETPKNDFGYPDYVEFFTNNNSNGKTLHNISTMYRYLAPWKKRKCAEILRKHGYNPFSMDYMEF